MRSTVAVINRENLVHNIGSIKRLVPSAEIIAVVKANAYGHGIVEVSKILEQEGIGFFGVAFANEGVSLRLGGIDKDILVLVPGNSYETKIFPQYDLQVAVSSIDFLRTLSVESVRQGKTLKAHLFIDTGMSRDGVFPGQAVDFMKEATNLPNVEMVGLMSHFATADSHPDFARTQLERFISTKDTLSKAGFNFKYVHIANTAGLVNFPESQFTAVRPGLSIYGYSPAPDMAEKLDVRPVMTLKTKVMLVRRIKKGDTVGYSMHFVSDKDTNIATIPIGYGDGFTRLLMHKAECLINGKRYKLVGTVCMDESMVDVGDDDVKPGDEVVLIGSQDGESILADQIAGSLGTIPYEITTAVSARVPRLYV
jgi:alanine racemase